MWWIHSLGLFGEHVLDASCWSLNLLSKEFPEEATSSGPSSSKHEAD